MHLARLQLHEEPPPDASGRTCLEIDSCVCARACSQSCMSWCWQTRTGLTNGVPKGDIARSGQSGSRLGSTNLRMLRRAGQRLRHREPSARTSISRAVLLAQCFFRQLFLRTIVSPDAAVSSSVLPSSVFVDVVLYGAGSGGTVSYVAVANGTVTNRTITIRTVFNRNCITRRAIDSGRGPSRARLATSQQPVKRAPAATIGVATEVHAIESDLLPFPSLFRFQTATLSCATRYLAQPS